MNRLDQSTSWHGARVCFLIFTLLLGVRATFADEALVKTHCGKCHSWVFSVSEPFPQVMFLPCGTLDTAPQRGIDYHVFYSQRAAWIDIQDDVPKYPEMLPEEELARWAP